jgi:hypothetical protein
MKSVLILSSHLPLGLAISLLRLHACYTTHTYRDLGAGAWAVAVAGSHGHVDAGAGYLTAAVARGRPTGAGGCGGEAHLVRVPLVEQRHVVRQEAGVQGLGRRWGLVDPAVRRPATRPGSKVRYLGCLQMSRTACVCMTTTVHLLLEENTMALTDKPFSGFLRMILIQRT